MLVYIVVLAMVAVFLGLRLYAVLGKRTGHEQVFTNPAEDRATAPLTIPRVADPAQDVRDQGPQAIEARAQSGLRALIAADSSFDVAGFLDGAKNAYRMILEAFWKGDTETLDWLAEDHVRDAFGEAIKARGEAGHVLDNRLVSIERALITEATITGRLVRISVAFDADIAAITRDGEGTLIAGSTSDAVVTHDVWTFSRTLKSGDPNWKLADTDEA
ncbi:Tim44/TimA family putative adaptor protein [Sphingomonas bacterium]|uniref:Tim44/TimA family putative adaptor protein n=1 Tax=Sphingomonas bacterium TaxID=1895847 RepID=UPI00260A2F42|nr:Tim44/TimA family putative adaptor protein [Sphingomonas bacterium]MDB5679218.1 preprotein translocase subunit Tim44 [Sphingomonas bacterium]